MKPATAIALALPAAAFIVIVGLGAISPVDYALGVLAMCLVIVAVEILEGRQR